jgi:A/G-specific adenine glycosylase
MASSQLRRKTQDSKGAHVRRALLRWFRKHRRPLPWRLNQDPYRVWVSEIMLQQTQIATVIPFYERFLRTFPTVTSLARAPLERVLELWSGLGYYRRARQLHAAARKIVAEYGGSFPRLLEQAKSLPGVGSYTAAAVLSIAYGVPLAALDGNIARVMARLEGRKGSLAEATFRQAIEGRLATLLSRRSPGEFNQALMELGQTVCLPRAPRCDTCPILNACQAGRQGSPENFPAPRPRRSTEKHHLAVALAFEPISGVSVCTTVASAANSKDRVLVIRGLDDGLMSDLWNFPAAFGPSPSAARSRLTEKLSALGTGQVLLGPELARIRHAVTYRDIQVRIYGAEIAEAIGEGIRWLALSRFRNSAISQLTRKIAVALLKQRFALKHGGRHSSLLGKERSGTAIRGRGSPPL